MVPSSKGKNMKYLSIILLFSCISCSWNTATITTGYGQSTAIHSINHIKPGDDYTVKNIAVILDNIEFNISDHRYQTAEYRFNNVSVGAKYHLSKTFSFFFADIGAGCRLTEVDERNKWLAESHFLADISFSTGIKKEFERFNFNLFYTFQHLSVPGRHDRGLNYDIVQFGISIPFF